MLICYKCLQFFPFFLSAFYFCVLNFFKYIIQNFQVFNTISFMFSFIFMPRTNFPVHRSDILYFFLLLSVSSFSFFPFFFTFNTVILLELTWCTTVLDKGKKPVQKFNEIIQKNMKVASKKLTFPPSPLGRGSTVQRGADSKHCPPTSFPPLREGKSIVVPLRSPSKGQ